MLNWKENGYFPIHLGLHRNHIENLGYAKDKVAQLTDGDMEYIAKRIADDFFAKYYAEALRETVEYFMESKKSTESITDSTH